MYMAQHSGYNASISSKLNREILGHPYVPSIRMGYTQIIAIDTHCVTTEARGNADIWAITERHSIPRSRSERNCNRCLSSGHVTYVPQERYLIGEQTAGVIAYLILLSRSKTAALGSLTRRDTVAKVCAEVSPLLDSRLFFCVLKLLPSFSP